MGMHDSFIIIILDVENLPQIPEAKPDKGWSV